MSLVPLVIREVLKELCCDKPTTLLHTGYVRPWRSSQVEDSGVSSVVKDQDGLKISLDVQQFKPEELSVKVVNDFVVVEGKHEERNDDHGLVSRQFTRRYRLPGNVDKDAVKSTLSSDNVLQLTAPIKVVEEKDVINIPISKINLPASPFTSPKPPAQKRMKIEVGA